MMPAANQGAGMNMGMPDVCTTPAAPSPIPIPYPNMGMNAMSMPFIPNMLISMAPAQNMSAKPLLTNGDNAGVAHPLFMQPGGALVGNPIILLGGMPAAHLGMPTQGNNYNAPLGSKTVPSVTNVLLASAALLVPEDAQSAARQLQAEASTARLLTGSVAVLQIPCISLRSDRRLAGQLRWFAGQGARSLVIDLRGNPGGSVEVALRMADMLADAALPTAIVLDRHTASAAELLAARLQDGQCARLFGERSYGKGTAMSFWCGEDWLFPSGLVTAMLRHDGSPVQGRGVSPDLPCASGDALSEALHWLRTFRSKRT